MQAAMLPSEGASLLCVALGAGVAVYQIVDVDDGDGAVLGAPGRATGGLVVRADPAHSAIVRGVPSSAPAGFIGLIRAAPGEWLVI